MKKILLSLLCLVAGLSLAQSPNYITAADLSYECQNNKRYLIKLDVYTECGNNFSDLTNKTSFSMEFKSDKLGISEGFNVIKTQANRDGEKIKIFCEQNLTNCEIIPV